MAEEMGVRYQPGVDAQMGPRVSGASVTGSVRGASPQQAVRILSLRVPPAFPASAPVSRTLWTNPGSAGPGADDAMSSMIKHLADLFRPPQTPNAPTLPTFPTQGMGAQTAGAENAPRPSTPMPQGPSLANPMPQAAPSAPPQFDGLIDTPPMQNAPPFEMGTQFDQQYANNYNILERLAMGDNWQAPGWAAETPFQWPPAPRRTVAPGPNVQYTENQPRATGGTNT